MPSKRKCPKASVGKSLPGHAKRRPPKTHYNPPNTPTRTRVLYAIENNSQTSPLSHRAIFKKEGVAESTGRDIIKSQSARRLDHSFIGPRKRRGRPPRYSLWHQEQLLEKVNRGEFEKNTAMWPSIAASVGIFGVCYDTIKNYLPRNVRKHPAALQYTLKGMTEDERVIWCVNYLSWAAKNWKCIWFSDEVHIGLGPVRQARVAR